MDENWMKIMETRERMKWHKYLEHVVVLCLNHIWLFCNPMDCSPPGPSVHGISQSSILGWVALPFLSPGDLPDSGIEPISCIANRFFTAEPLLLLRRFSRVRLCVTPCTAAYQAPPSMGFSRQEYWSRVSLPSPILLYPATNWWISQELVIAFLLFSFYFLQEELTTSITSISNYSIFQWSHPPQPFTSNLKTLSSDHKHT